MEPQPSQEKQQNPDWLAFSAVAVTFFLTNFSAVLYTLAGRDEPGLASLMATIAAGSALYFWLYRDMRRYGISYGLDLGYFIFLASPVLLLYHVFKTRGMAGFKTVGIFIGLWAACWAAGLIAAIPVVMYLTGSDEIPGF
jgi:hypothetical protein